MIFLNPLEKVFHLKMMFHDWMVEMEIILHFLHFLHFLRLFSLTHVFEDLNDGKSVCAHVLDMKLHIDRLGMLGVEVSRKLVVDLVL